MKNRIFKGTNPFVRLVLLFIGALLLTLALMASLALTESNAALRTQVSSSDEARVAKFRVTVSDPECISTDHVLDSSEPSDEIRYRFTVRNDSEVDMAFQISVDGIPNTVSASYVNGSGVLARNGSETSGEMILTISNSDDLSDDLLLQNVQIIVTCEQTGGAS